MNCRPAPSQRVKPGHEGCVVLEAAQDVANDKIKSEKKKIEEARLDDKQWRIAVSYQSCVSRGFKIHNVKFQISVDLNLVLDRGK